MKAALALAAALLAAATPAAAQLASMMPKPLTDDMLAQIDVLPVERMCSTRGAYQYAFGSTDLPPSPFGHPGMDRRPLPASAAPFVEGAFSATKWSNRFFMVEYHLYLETGAQALTAIERLARRYRALGWAERPGGVEEDGPLFDFPPGEGDVAFYSEGQATGIHRTGIRAEFSHLGGWVTFTCTSMPMIIVQMGEAFGNLPEGTPRPVAPATPRPEALNLALCTTPEGITQVAGLFGADTNTMLRYILERTNYRERLVTWKADRLEKAGVSSDRILQITMAGLHGTGDPAGGLPDMLQKLGEIARLEKAGDKAGACRGSIALMKQLEAMLTVTNRQWDAIEAGLDAEAKRIGVSLE